MKKKNYFNKETFGPKSKRKRVKINNDNLEEMVNEIETK
jgi:hypothetical protein